jgi:hypothetical protein
MNCYLVNPEILVCEIRIMKLKYFNGEKEAWTYISSKAHLFFEMDQHSKREFLVNRASHRSLAKHGF